MTTREFLIAVTNTSNSAEVIDKANELLSALDAKNAKRKSTPTKEQKEAMTRRAKVLEFLKNNPDTAFTRDQIAEAVNITPTQATSACNILKDYISKAETKIDKARRVVYQYKPSEETDAA